MKRPKLLLMPATWCVSHNALGRSLKTPPRKHGAALERVSPDLKARLEIQFQRTRLAATKADRGAAEIRYVSDRSSWQALVFRPSGRLKKCCGALSFSGTANHEVYSDHLSSNRTNKPGTLLPADDRDRLSGFA